MKWESNVKINRRGKSDKGRSYKEGKETTEQE